MNAQEIYNKRIKEAAYEESSTYDLTEIKESNAAYNAAIKVANFALKNQWISVEEALPPLTQISGKVYLTIDKNGCADVKARNIDGWSSSRGWCSTERITHWMCIPSLEGGEK